jgi:hypothetical protein
VFLQPLEFVGGGAAFPAVPSAEPVEVGELTTYLNDAVLLAPLMLLGLATTTPST